MAYPGTFHRLVLMGTLYDDTFNTTLSIVPVPGQSANGLPPAEDMLPLVAGTLQPWWSKLASAGGAGIHSAAILTSLKLNAIGADGKYVDNETHEQATNVPLPGGGSGTYPAQLATVLTLRTAVPRGLASKGRMFLPVCTGFDVTQADGRATDTQAGRVAEACADWIDAVNAVYFAEDGGSNSLGRVGVASNRGAGKFQLVTHVSVGRVTDTIRSRRNKQLESPVEAIIAL